MSLTQQLVVVRKVKGLSEAVMQQFIEAEPQAIWQGDEDGDWILEDPPRDNAITDEIVASTTGFGVADPNMDILAVFPGKTSLERAIKAKSGASVKLHFEVEGLDTGEDTND